MAFVQYTHCVKRDEWASMTAQLGWGIAVAAGTILVGTIGTLLAGLAGGPAGTAVGAITAYTVVDRICKFMLGGKLICLRNRLDHDHAPPIDYYACVIGRVAALEEVGFNKPPPKNIDNDYSINILPAPHSVFDVEPDAAPGDPVNGPAVIEDDGLFGFYLKQQPSTRGLLPFAHRDTNNVYRHAPGGKEYKPPALHCEFEGSRIYDVCLATRVALAVSAGLGIAALIGCLIFPPICLLAWWVLPVVAGAIVAATIALSWALASGGDPADAGLPEGEIEIIREDGTGGDYVLVRGDWVWDGGHGESWNEIHPVVSVQKIFPYAGADAVFKPDETKKTTAQDIENARRIFRLKTWCLYSDQGMGLGVSVGIVGTTQQKLEDQWEIHPDVDGCEPQDSKPTPVR